MTAVDTAPVGELVWLDPKAIAKHPANIRRATGDITGLTASIRRLGVRVPLLAKYDDDQRVVVIAGHRRLEAAIAAERVLVPVFVSAGDGTDLEDMAAENLQRLELTAAEEAEAYVQLQAEGLDVATIAETTGMSLTRVEKGLQGAGSKAAAKAAAKLQELTLDQMATLAEFDGNDQAQADLTSTVKTNPGQFDHIASKLRAAAASEAAYQAELERLKATGVKVVEKAPGWHYAKNSPISYLHGKVTAAVHKKCEGDAVSIVRGHPKPSVVKICTDPKKFHPRASDREQPKPKPPTAAELAKVEAAAKELEERTLEWEAAAPVRHAFVERILARKTAPKGTLGFVTKRILDTPRVVDMGGPLQFDIEDLEKRQARAADAELPLLLLALVADGVETQLKSQYRPWTTPPPGQQWMGDRRPLAAAYFAWLVTTGYTLAPIEQAVVDGQKPKPAKRAAAKKTVKKATKAGKKAASRG